MIAQTIRNGARLAFHRLGGLRVLRWRNRRGLRILMYHRFAAEDVPALERQCAHIRRYYAPLSMPKLVEMLQADEPLPDNAAVVTVDDGHRDFLLNAWPVLRRYEIPATVYLISGFVDGELWPWFDRVLWMFANTPLRSAEIVVTSQRMALDLAESGARDSAGQRIANLLPDLSSAERAEILAELPERLKVTVPAQAPPEYASLSWDDARALAQEQVDFGGHTVTHPILSRMADERQLAWEVSHSKARIEHELGREAVSFCYPNGRPSDVDDAGVEAVKRAGYRVAVLAGGGLNHSCRDRFRLRRVPCGFELSDPYFRQIMAGFRSGKHDAQ
jgi:peptidoglycan/xylan/chitin deacetylase (PgdA/CDA1 family)